MGNGVSADGRHRLSIALIGERRVGKSNLLDYLATGRPPLDQEAYYMTVAPNVETIAWKTQDGIDVQVQVWDTAGDPGFTELAFPYLRYADAFVFMYDITNNASFEALHRWWDLTEGLVGEGAGLAFALVGTHTDRGPRRVVSHDRAIKFLLERGVPHTMFFEVSTVTGDKVQFAADAIVARALAVRQSGVTTLDESIGHRKNTGFRNAVAAFASVEADRGAGGQEGTSSHFGTIRAMVAEQHARRGELYDDPDRAGAADGGSGEIVVPGGKDEQGGFLASLFSCGGRR